MRKVGNNTECTQCGKGFYKAPSKKGVNNFCSRECKDNHGRITRDCVVCGTTFTQQRWFEKKVALCGIECTRKWTSERMSQMNKDINHTRMVPETRAKLREARLSMVEAQPHTYKKHYGRHVHRIVAEEKLGRPLKKGEVVHHIDGNKHNNHPDNIQVLPSQSEHARIHNIERYENRK